MIGKLFIILKAFIKTAIPERAQKGFEVCGLWLYDPQVFNDEVFEAAPQPSSPAAPQPDPSASTSSSGGFKVIPSSGDGRCFFRSLVIGMDSRLQNEARDSHGRLLSRVKHAVETSRNDGLRAEVITYMMDNYSDYKDLDLAVINSNMPVHFASVDERIVAMTDPKCLPGELEIVATSRAMKKKSVYLEKTTMK